MKKEHWVSIDQELPPITNKKYNVMNGARSATYLALFPGKHSTPMFPGVKFPVKFWLKDF